MKDEMDFISTGGGVTLELLSGKTLPGFSIFHSIIHILLFFEREKT